MKRLGVIIFLAIGIPVLALAQADSVQNNPKLFTTQLRNGINPGNYVLGVDTIKLPGTSSFDTLKLKKENIADSIRSVRGKAEELQHKVGSKVDSLQTLLNTPVDYTNKKLSAIQDKIDQAGDSLQRRFENVTNKANKIQKDVQGKVDSLQQKATSTLTNTQQKIESKIQEVTGEKVKIPGAEKIDVSAGELPKTTLPDVDIPSEGINKAITLDQNVEMPGTEKLSLPKDALKIGTPEVKLPGVNDLEEVGKVSEQIKNIDGQLEQGEKIEKDLKELKEGNPEKVEELSKQAEQKLANVEQVKAATGEMEKVTAEQAKYEALIQKYRDKKLIQEEMKRKSAAVANDLLTKQSDKVKQAQDAMVKSKRGLSSVKSVKDVFKRRSEELVGKKFYQRLVPGVNWQLYNKEVFTADLAFQLGYRITPRLTMGIGAIYRLGFDEDFKYFVKGMNTYGYRGYLDLSISKGLFVHGEFEGLRTDSVTVSTTAENLTHNFYGSYFGLGKRFSISRNFKASVLALYRIDYNGELPDVSKVSLRFGIDYVFKRPRRKLPGE